ncbi:MAG: glycosyltransferase [Chloroflexi bacterium]|nr:glycosyltransferase [Chloroflexota bacterium]
MTVLNEAQSLPEVLADLAAQDVLPAEIIVVDGGSTDSSQDLARSAGVRLVDAPGANISQGRNRGIAAATCDLLALTDAGVRLPTHWLREITAPLLDGSADLVAGFFEAAPRSTFEIAMGATVLPDVREVEPEKFLPSSRSVAFTRQLWKQAGGYPEWLDYCEDLIFDIRARQVAGSGRVAFVPQATVSFRPRPNLRAFVLQYFRYARGDGKALLFGRRHAIRYATYGSLIAILLAPLGPIKSPARLAAIAAGLGYVARPAARLRRAWAGRPLAAKAAMLALLPVIRLAGDLAKMAGYPAGLLWRLRNDPPDWR